MFCFVLFAFVLSLGKNKVTELNYRAFRKNILNRTEEKTWIVLFYDENNKKQREVHNQFVKTASLALDILNFASVDAKKNVQLAEDCDIFEQNLPKIMVYYYKGKTEYVGNKRPDKMATNLLKFLPRVAKNANFSWKQDLIDGKTKRKCAILFANNESVPDFWNAVAGSFMKDDISIGYSNNQTLFDMFDIIEVPAIIFLNESGQYDYHGRTSFKSLKDAIQSFLYGKFQINNDSPKQNEKEPYYFSDEFEKVCFSHRSYCVVHNSDNLDEQFEKIHDESSGKPFKWFYGSENWPFSFIKDNTIWIFNPRNKKVIHVKSMDDLRTKIENIDMDYIWYDISNVSDKTTDEL